MSRSTRYALYIAVLVLPFAVFLHLYSHLQLERISYHQTYQTADDEPVFPTFAAGTAGLNYRTAFSDILWVGAFLHRTEQAEVRRPAPGVTAYADAIIELDPYFHPLYSWHNTFRYTSQPAPTIEDRDEANRILATGLEYFPDDWKLARSLVINNANPRFDRTREQQIRDLEQAIHYAQLGAQAEDAGPEMTGLAINYQNRLAELRDDDESADDELSERTRDFLVGQYFAADDETQQEFIRNVLEHAGVDDELTDAINRHSREFQATRLDRYPYLTPELFAVIDSTLYQWHMRNAY